MPMMMLQILKFMDSSKIEKCEYLEYSTSFFHQTKNSFIKSNNMAKNSFLTGITLNSFSFKKKLLI